MEEGQEMKGMTNEVRETSNVKREWGKELVLGCSWFMDTLWRLGGGLVHTASILKQRRMNCGVERLRMEKSVFFGKNGINCQKRNGGLVDVVAVA